VPDQKSNTLEHACGLTRQLKRLAGLRRAALIPDKRYVRIQIGKNEDFSLLKIASEPG
jgi:hypothetical protein